MRAIHEINPIKRLKMWNQTMPGSVYTYGDDFVMRCLISAIPGIHVVVAFVCGFIHRSHAGMMFGAAFLFFLFTCAVFFNNWDGSAEAEYI